MQVTYCTVGLTQEPAKQQLIDNVACGAATGTTSRYDFLVVPNAPMKQNRIKLKGFFNPPLYFIIEQTIHYCTGLDLNESLTTIHFKIK